MTKPELSIVIPCYNESKNIPLILKGFYEVVGDINIELILVNNGSTDDSQKILEKELKKPEYSFAKTILVQKNIGYGHGIMFGLKRCQADIVAYTHADMQCDPFDVIRGYKIISKKENPEKYLIKGWRRLRKIMPQLFTSGLQFVATSLFLKDFNEINAQPKVFHRNFLNKLEHPPSTLCLDFYLLYKAKKEKIEIIDIPVDFLERQHGESKWNFSHLSKIKGIYSYIQYLIILRFLGEEKATKK